jgi:hypothetical protein
MWVQFVYWNLMDQGLGKEKEERVRSIFRANMRPCDSTVVDAWIEKVRICAYLTI